MQRAKAMAGLVLALAALASACGGSSSSSGPAGVDSSKQVSAVSEADKGSLCDWFVGMVGGYGATSACADADLEAPPSKTDCMDTFPTCDVTIALLEDCISRLVAAQNACTQEAITAAETSMSCQTVGAAGCFN